LEYTDKELKIVQYFASNHARSQKIKSLEKKQLKGDIIKIETESLC
jgi:hypothetical protein